jgi:two-component SAPR family response regulator
VLVLTARDSWSDKVAGLDGGADDYLAKPFQTEELIARLRALIRRASGNSSSELIAGGVRLDTRSGRVTLDGEPVKLTAQEYKLLSYLLHHKGKVVSRTELIEHIYDQDFDRDRTRSRSSSPASARSWAPMSSPPFVALATAWTNLSATEAEGADVKAYGRGRSERPAGV